MKEKISRLVEYIPAADNIVNLGMNENHHVDWNDKLPIPISQLAQSYDYSTYGDNAFQSLKDIYAQYTGLQSENVLPFSGSESAIGILMNSLANGKVLLFTPDFFRFEEIADVYDVEVVKYNIRDGIDIDEVIQIIKKQAITFCIYSTPNNPMGIEMPREIAERLAQETEAYIVADEAYFEFGNQTVVDLIPKYDNLLVMRTTSKAWGLAGMRIGFVLAQKELVDYLQKSVGVFHINTMSTDIVAFAMEHEDYMREQVANIISLRTQWEQKLAQKYGFIVTPSNTNFIYVEHPDSLKIWSYLQQNNIRISKFDDRYLRISIGLPEEMDILEVALDAYFN